MKCRMNPVLPRSRVRLERLANPRRRYASQGYSLLEILVVLAIIAVLATLVGPRLFSQLDKSKIVTARAQIQTLATALDSLMLDMGRYPTANEGIGLLMSAPVEQSQQKLWRGPYLNNAVPADPWGNAYVYQAPPPGSMERPKITSLGADGTPSSDDISS